MSLEISLKSMFELPVLDSTQLTGQETVLLSSAQADSIATLATIWQRAQQNYSNVENLPVISATDIQNKDFARVYITYDTLLAALETLGNQLTSGQLAALLAHLTDYGNPHNVTQTQVGLSNVANYPPVNAADITAKNFSVSYITYDKLYNAIMSLGLSFTIPTLNGTAVNILSGSSVELSVSIANSNGYNMATTQISFQMMDVSQGQTTWTTLNTQPYSATATEYTYTVSGLNATDLYGFQAVLTDTSNPDLNVVSSGGNTTLYQPSGNVDVFDIAGNTNSLTTTAYDQNSVVNGPNTIFNNNRSVSRGIEGSAKIITLSDPTVNSFLGLTGTTRIQPYNRLPFRSQNTTSKFYLNRYDDILTGDDMGLVVNNTIVDQIVGTDVTIGTEVGELPAYFSYGKPSIQNKTKITAGLTDIAKGLQATSGLMPANGSYGSLAESGSFLYYVGGYSSTDASNYNLDYVLAAPINADGTLGTWFKAGTLPNGGGYGLQSFVANNTLYVTGMPDETAIQNNVVYSAPLNADGTIGIWTEQPHRLPDGGNNYGSAYLLLNGTLADPTTYAAGQTVWMFGGNMTIEGVSTFLLCAPVNADGTVGPWVKPYTTYQMNLYQPALGFYSGYSYLISARTGPGSAAAQSTNMSSQIASGSDVPGYLQSTNFPYPSTLSGYNGAAVVAHNGFLYTIGGIDSSSNASAKVMYVPIGAGGGLKLDTSGGNAVTESWTDVGSDLPVTLVDAKAVVIGNYIYVVGGINGTTPSAVTYSALINADGTLGAWTDTTNNLPQAVYRSSLVVIGNYLYNIGGVSDSAASVYVSNVYMAAINANGTLGAWADSGVSLPMALSQTGAVVNNGYLYVFGGMASGGAVSTIYYSAISTNDTLGAWTTNATGLFAATAIKAALTVGKSIFYIGTTSTYVYQGTLSAAGAVSAFTGTNSTLPAAGSARPGFTFFNGNLWIVDGAGAACYGAFVGNVETAVKWTTLSNNMPANIANMDAVVGWQYNGNLYMMDTNFVNNPISNFGTVYAAALGASGALGNWASVANLISDPLDLFDGLPAESQLIFDRAYMNRNGTAVNILGAYMPTENMGPGFALSASYNTSNVLGDFTITGDRLGVGVRYGVPMQIGNNMFLLGEWGRFLKATINSAGTPTGWTNESNILAKPRYQNGLAANNGFVYIVGGKTEDLQRNINPTTDVFYTTIDAAGNTGIPVATTSLPAPLYDAAVIVNNGYLYVVGGFTTGDVSVDTVYYASINTDGTLGAWVTNANALPAAVGSLTLAIDSGFLYALGGQSAIGTLVTTAYYATINTDGSIAAWTTNANALPAPMRDMGIMFGASNMYIIGYRPTQYEYGTNIIYTASVSAGALGAFTQYSAMGTMPNNNGTNRWYFLGKDVNNAINPNNLFVIAYTQGVNAASWSSFSFYIDSNDALNAVNGFTYNVGDLGLYPPAVGDVRGVLYNGLIVMNGSIDAWYMNNSSDLAPTNTFVTGPINYAASDTLVTINNGPPLDAELMDICEYNGTYYLFDSANLRIYQMTPDANGNPTNWTPCANQPPQTGVYNFNAVTWVTITGNTLYAYVSNNSGNVQAPSSGSNPAYTPVLFQASFDATGALGVWSVADTSAWPVGIYNYIGIDDAGLLLNYMSSTTTNVPAS